MSNSFIPYGRQTVTQADIDSVLTALRSPFLTQGPLVPRFEQLLSSTLESKHTLVANSATSCLHLSCLSLGLGRGDLLWTSPITFVASANCARYCQADVDFVDIDPSTGLICLNALEKKLTTAANNNTLPKIFVPVHLAGTSCNMADIYALVKPYDIYIIEDASHAVGAKYQGLPVGNCSFSDISVFSFHPVKIITTAEGGAACTNQPHLYEAMLNLRSHGIIRDEALFEFPSPGPWAYEQQHLGFNYRLTDIQAALGISQLSRLNDIVKERNQLLSNYEFLCKDLPITFLNIPKDCYSSVHLAVMRLLDSDSLKHRAVFNGLRSAGIGVQLHYLPVHLHPYYRSLGFTEGDFPHAEEYSKSSISLPLFPGLTLSSQRHIVSTLAALLQ